jgi:hypothetical protein
MVVAGTSTSGMNSIQNAEIETADSMINNKKLNAVGGSNSNSVSLSQLMLIFRALKIPKLMFMTRVSLLIQKLWF